MIKYDRDDATKFDWGSSVDKRGGGIVGVKILLDTKQESPFLIPSQDGHGSFNGSEKSIVEVAADFIRAIYQHALLEIAKTVPNGYMEMCRKDHVLSGIPSPVCYGVCHFNLIYII